MSRTLRMNDTLCAPGNTNPLWQVVDPTPRGGSVKLFNFEKHQEEYHPVAEINDALVNGRLVRRRKSAPLVGAAAQNDPALEERLRTAMKQVRAIEQLQRKLNISIDEAYARVSAEMKATQPGKPFASRSTIYRYLKAKRNGLPLLRGAKNQGNRTPRYDPSVRDVVVRVAKAHFLQPESRWSMGDLVRYANDQLREQGLLGENQLLSADYVRKCIREDASVDPEIDRMDPKSVAAAKSIASDRILAQVPFERVEQDAVHLPFVVQTAHGETSNVYLVHAIDCCTSMPLGWHMVIGQPAESDGLRCIESILFSKEPAFERLGLQQELDLFGTPHQLIFDNGAETRGDRMRRMVCLGIDTMHCKSRHAHGKPFIERLNRSLKEALQILPGCTRVDGKDGQRDPLALGDPLMSAEELERWIVRWYYESWAHTPLKRHVRTSFQDGLDLGNTPALRWKRITEDLSTPLPLSPSQKEWREALYEHHERTLSRKSGVTFGGFNYRGGNLPYLLGKYGETPVKILVNPDDYREIFVNESDDLPLVALVEEFVDETSLAYSFSQMKEYRKQERAQSRETAESAKFRQDVQQAAIKEKGKRSGRKRTRAERNRSVSDAVKESAALLRAADAPLSAPLSTLDSELSTSSVVIDLSDHETAIMPVLSRIDGEELA